MEIVVVDHFLQSPKIILEDNFCTMSFQTTASQNFVWDNFLQIVLLNNIFANRKFRKLLFRHVYLQLVVSDRWAVRVVQVVQVVSLDNKQSESIRFTWSKPSNYCENSGCEACDSRTTGHSEIKVVLYLFVRICN